ncbi:Uncharacterised protein [Chlamydia abortus]|nr:Uncharacterised protein [Chlamydia abortus]
MPSGIAVRIVSASLYDCVMRDLISISSCVEEHDLQSLLLINP